MRNTMVCVAAVAAMIALPAGAQSMDGNSTVSRMREGARATTQQPAVSDSDVAEADNRRSLETELSKINAYLSGSSRLLERVAAGDYLVGSDDMLVALSRAEIVAKAQNGNAGAFDQGDPLVTFDLAESRVSMMVRAAARRSAMLAEELRQRRQQWLLRRDRIMRDIEAIRRRAMADADRPGSAYDPNADYSISKYACSLPHRWRFDVQGMGSSTWTVDAAGQAQEAGLGSARGRAQFSGGSLRIEWTTGAYAGFYTAALDGDCNGRGTLQWTRSPSGPASFPVIFTSLGGKN